MGVKCAVNGFGRVGRYLVRAALGYDDIEIVAVNSRAKASILAHLLKYDSVHGKFPGEVSFSDKALIVNGREIRITNITDNCALLPWKGIGVDIVLESTGEFRKKAEVAPHLEAGAKKVIIAAPGKGIDGTFVMGVNEETYDPAKHHIVSNASCTTNCLAPVVKVLHDAFGIKRGLMTTLPLLHDGPEASRRVPQRPETGKGCRHCPSSRRRRGRQRPSERSSPP